MVDRVTADGGTVNKFEGDAALCVFGAPEAQADHAARALAWPPHLPDAVVDRARRSASASVSRPVSRWPATSAPPQRYEYTVIGDVVNTAARLCDLAKESPGHVLASAETVAAAGERVATDGDRWRAAGSVQLRGRTADTPVFEPA